MAPLLVTAALVAVAALGVAIWLASRLRRAHEEARRAAFLHYIKQIADSEERKRAAEQLSLLGSIISDTSDAIYSRDMNGIIETWNRGAERIFGWKASDAIGRRFEDVMASDRREVAQALHQRVIAGERVAGLELTTTNADGHTIDVQLALSPISDDSGIVGVSVIARDVTAARRAHREVQAALREKDIMLKELHHRVKNNMQVISSLLSLQAATVDDAATQQALRDIQARVRAMALFHERVYQASDLARVDICAYLESVANSAAAACATAGRVAVHMAGHSVDIGADAAIPCGLIVNELVTNSFKHAFRDGRDGRIDVAIRSEGRELVLTVADDGAGFPPGFTPDGTATLGLQLVCTLAEQIGGSATFDGRDGARVTIRIPAPPAQELAA